MRHLVSVLSLAVSVSACSSDDSGSKSAKERSGGAASVRGWCGVERDPDPNRPGIQASALQWSLPITVTRSDAIPEAQWTMIRGALTSWETAAGQTLFAITPEPEARSGENFTTLDGSLGDRINSNYYDSSWQAHTGKPAGVLATTVFRDVAGEPEADIRYNLENFTYGDAGQEEGSADKPVVDLETVALHELGHLLGLGHVDEATDADSVMHLSILIGRGNSKRALSEGDRARLRQLLGLAP